MPKTPLMAELQITQEYSRPVHARRVPGAACGRSSSRPTRSPPAPGSTVARVIEGDVHPYADTGIAGVANTGSDSNWTGHDLAQANWHAYGRLAWNPVAVAGGLADEWVRMTWCERSRTSSKTITGLLLAIVRDVRRYTMPLGLHHLIGGDHYEPMPENPDPRRADWSAIYYHRADRERRRLRSLAARQQCRRAVPLALARAVGGSEDDTGDAAAVVPPPAVDVPDGLGPHAVGGHRRALHARRRGSRRRSSGRGSPSPDRWTRSGTRQSPRSCISRRSTPPPGATSASATSGSSPNRR